MRIRLLAWELLRDLLFPANRDDATADMPARLGRTGVQTEILQQANASYVTAALWQALRRSGLDALLIDDVGEYLEAFYVLNAERNARIRRQLFECIGVLNRADVIPMPLKGAAYLLSDLYPEPAERFLADVDLLIPVTKASDAASALAAVGFQPAPSKFDYTGHHHLPGLVRSLDDVAVELHTAPVLALAQGGLSTDEIWAGARGQQATGCRWLAASTTDAAMLSFLHGEVVDRDLARCIVNLRGFQDLDRLVERDGDEIDWERNRDRARRGGVLPAFFRYVSVFGWLTGRSVARSVAGRRLRGRAHYSLCRLAVRWRSIQRWAGDLQALRARRLMQRYAIGSNPVTLTAYRIRALGGIVRKRLGR